ncbi:exonuclease domain-containing protein [Streptomyces sp. 184]|uniref:exonuclease domain-containing protein n=1 Tax=Streptomyces sp. 184 TaxID=1827526 RepID=UPI003891C2B9
MGWYGELLVGFDLETTGTDPGEARIVSAAVVEAVRGVPARRREWLADPGVPVPPETTAIHGITDERATAHGRPAAEVADEVADVLAAHWSRGVPVVAYNATFDLTLLAAELRRHGLASMRERLGGGKEGPVIDPYAMDRTVDPFREGKRTLEAVCVEYGVVLGRAHDAAEDALAAVRLAVAIAERYGEVAAAAPWDLHRGQEDWHAERAEGYRQWLVRQSRGPAPAGEPPAPAAEPVAERGFGPDGAVA